MALKRGIEKGVVALRDQVGTMSTPVEGRIQIAQVASLSAHDDMMGELIADVMERVGKDGVITVDESKGLDFEQDFVEGMEIDRGYISPYFITDQEKMESSIDDPYILITDKKVSAVADVLPALEKILQVSKNLVIISEDIDGEGARHPSRQQAARHAKLPRCQGAGLRRQAQGDAGRHGYPHGRSGHQRRGRSQARLRIG